MSRSIKQCLFVLSTQIVLQILLTIDNTDGFQFMKSWKMPTYDPHEEAIQERFGDKSTFITHFDFTIYVFVFALLFYSFLFLFPFFYLTHYMYLYIFFSPD
jgi:hypothetical protein